MIAPRTAPHFDRRSATLGLGDTWIQSPVEEARILIVDDEPAALMLLERILRRAGYQDVVATGDPREVLPLVAVSPPDLIVLDLQMPHRSGLQLLDELRAALPAERNVPVLVITADLSREARERALASGARDFLNKPFDRTEALLRVRNLLETRALTRALQTSHARLEEAVELRTRELADSRTEILERLTRAAEIRDDQTGRHTRRVASLSAEIASELGLPPERLDLLLRAAPLHDIGKIGIPDAVLLKPDRLTPEETEAIRAHTVLGAQLLSGSTCTVLQVAERIALSHHERWDGQGYPLGLAGEQIPLEARIVAVADVFDALAHPRPYRQALPRYAAVATVREGSGTRFDPRVVDAFLRVISRTAAD